MLNVAQIQKPAAGPDRTSGPSLPCGTGRGRSTTADSTSTRTPIDRPGPVRRSRGADFADPPVRCARSSQWRPRRRVPWPPSIDRCAPAVLENRDVCRVRHRSRTTRTRPSPAAVSRWPWRPAGARRAGARERHARTSRRRGRCRPSPMCYRCSPAAPSPEAGRNSRATMPEGRQFDDGLAGGRTPDLVERVSNDLNCPRAVQWHGGRWRTDGPVWLRLDRPALRSAQEHSGGVRRQVQRESRLLSR